MAANCNYLGESCDSMKNALSWTVVILDCNTAVIYKMRESTDGERKQNVRGRKVWV